MSPEIRMSLVAGKSDSSWLWWPLVAEGETYRIVVRQYDLICGVSRRTHRQDDDRDHFW
jgi:hypothetical protein